MKLVRYFLRILTKAVLNKWPFLMGQHHKSGLQSLNVEVPGSHTIRHTLRRTNSNE